MTHQSASPRFGELAALGMILDSGRRRKTRSGRNAAVWAYVPEGEREGQAEAYRQAKSREKMTKAILKGYRAHVEALTDDGWMAEKTAESEGRAK